MMQTTSRPLTKPQAAFVALGLTLLMTGNALVQTAGAGGDVLGIATVRDAVIAAFKVLAAIGIAWGFVRLMGGRHTMEGLVIMGIGALGIAKVDAVASLMGL